MNRACKALLRAKSELWECGKLAGRKTSERKWWKRSMRRASRRMVPSLLKEQA